MSAAVAGNGMPLPLGVPAMSISAALTAPQVEHYAPGERVPDPAPGDFFLTHGDGLLDRLIRFGQRLRYRGPRRHFAYWNHAGLFVDADGTVVEARWHVAEHRIDRYDDRHYVVVRASAHLIPGEAEAIAEHARTLVGERYSIVTILSIVLSLLTGTRLTVGHDGQQICSGLVARHLDGRPVWMPRDPAHTMPADLAALYGIGAPT